MTLRRTALSRKVELRRSSELKQTPLVRRRELRARKVAVSSRRRDTGPTRATRALVLDRAQGCCELCGLLLHDGEQWARPHSVHHRRPRRAGGDPRPDTNSPANLLLLCGTGTTGCHGQVESNRRASLAHGWLLHADASPAEVGVDIGPFHVLTHLNDDGTYREADHQ